MNILYILSNLFAPKPKNNPIRLQKQSNKRTFKQQADDFVAKNFYFIVLATFLLIWIVLTIILINVFAGSSAVESGQYYYHFKEVI